MNKYYKKVISDIVEECYRNKIGLLLSPTKTVTIEGELNSCSGFFDPEDLTIRVAIKKPIKEWFLILLHEFNHSKQWIEGVDFGENNSFWEWVEGKIELSKTKIKKSVNEIVKLELDCEKRTTEMIKKHPELKINVEDYIIKSNIYLYFYAIVAKNRIWYNNLPYNDPKMKKIIPNKFIKNYWNVPMGFEEIINEKNKIMV